MRIAAISFPELRVEVVRSRTSARTNVDEGGGEGTPLAIVVAEAPLTEAKLLGNTRLDVVSHEARRLGVHPGQTIAQARARASSLAVRVVRPDAVHDVLARLAEVALAFGATVSFASASASDGRAAAEAGDLVWVDVTGCAHLHASAPNGSDGEAILASRLARVIGGLGHACAVAIADGPRVAAILARAAASAMTSPGGSGPESPPLIVVPPGKNALALAPLLVSALPLEDDDVRWLSKIGVRTITELRALPRSALATRLGARASLVLGLADGEDRAPLTPYVPPEIPEESASLEYGIEGTEALTFVAKMLADRLGTRLAGRAVAASRIELDLVLDVALLADAADGTPPERIQRISMELPVPLSAAPDLLAALRPKIERVVLRAPVLGARLRAATLVHKPQAVLSLFEPLPRAERALPRLVAELAADLGEEAVGKLALGNAWVPEERSKFVRLDAPSRVRERRERHMLSSVPEPTRILAAPVPVARDAVKVIRHLSRVESVDWWKQLPGEASGRAGKVPSRHGEKRGVDYVHAWVDEGAAWVELDRATGAARVRGWFD